ncbi:TPA: helix-turn-helix domain-containing protein [Salmonella enterica subsp. enterica serovar Newport]|nr:helix-turn-helix domain-containing protein [Salmonella enterica]EDJ8987653.1 transcriptional regulator [Salmonella enterica subsp. diarizonae]EGM1791288.1 helix-turn-helix domain-containing protein [Salmonella enterica subsp. enterica]EHA9470411.1 helix-turn-helix domain-containing protein [Salmonella enterica subsp. enterica serovar Bareilly]HCM2579035.1 helix-turn-helix domain-containing protein [Salmonella enterica subsp. enterica serovar Stanley]HDN7456105.1 helix-turn-helix domain-cont
MSKELLEIFSIKVQEVMSENGWNKSDLARQLKLSHTAVRKWVNGQCLATGDRLTRLSIITGKPTHWFFTDEHTGCRPPDDTANIQYTPLSKQEQALLSIFNKLSDTDKLSLMVHAVGLVQKSHS